MKHPKTTIAGIGLILTAVGTVLYGVFTGNPVDYSVVIGSFITGMGLILAGDAAKFEGLAGQIKGILGK